jgi:protein phosphatase
VEADLAGLTHRGKRRATNEDHFLIARLDRRWHKIDSNLPPEAVPDTSTETAYGLLVADGMGGHAGGEVASRAAVTCLVDLVLKTPDIIMRLDPVLTEEVLQRLDRRFRQIKDALSDQVRNDSSLKGMGTTMTLACTVGNDLLIAHVGDSRVYLYRNGALQRLTHDQTMAQFLADTGVIAPDAVATHPLRNVLTSVLGTSEGPMQVDLHGRRLADGDQLLLCTDGLTDMIPEPRIAEILGAASASAADTCGRLVDAALDAGGRDNITVIVARYTGLSAIS